MIILFENSNEYLEDCLNSIVYQSLNDIEIIFIENNVVNESENIIKNFSEKYDEIDINICDDLNFRNINSEYVIFVNANDWLDLNSLKCLYQNIKKDNLDILMFNSLTYKNSRFEKEPYHNFCIFQNEFIPKIFNQRDIFDLILSIPPSIYGKLYNSDLLRKINFKFNNISSFENNLFFFKTMLAANKISIYDIPLYIKREYGASVKLPKDILTKLVEYLNDVVDIFREYNLFEEYKIQLLNYKIEVLRFWFSFIKEDYKKFNFKYIQDDFLKMRNDEKMHDFLKNNLTQDNYFFFKTFRNSYCNNEIFLSYENMRLKEFNNQLMEQMEKDEFNVTNYDSFMDQTISWCDLLINLQNDLHHNLMDLKSDISDFKLENEILKEKISEKSAIISDLGCLKMENEILKEKIREDSIVISNLNDKNYYLNLKVDSLAHNDVFLENNKKDVFKIVSKYF